MRLLAIATGPLLLGMAAGLGSSAAARQPERVDYACGDVVVVGRAQTIDFEQIGNENDIPGVALITARVAVISHLAGANPRRPLVIRYVAHNDLNTKRDFLFVLRREAGDAYYSAEGIRGLDREDDAELASRCLEGARQSTAELRR